MINDHESGPILSLAKEVESERRPIITGKVDLDGDLHVYTGFCLPEINAILAVYESDQAIEMFIASTIRPVMQVGYILVAFVIGATAMITGFLLNRYETGLAAANARLENQVEAAHSRSCADSQCGDFWLGKISRIA